MSAFRPVVNSVKTEETTVIAKFQDGHSVTLAGYDDYTSKATEGLRYFWIFKQRSIVVQYHGQTQPRTRFLGPSEDEHRFIQVADGYTRDLIVAYWEATITFADNEYLAKIEGLPSDEAALVEHPAYTVIRASMYDLNYIIDGLIPLPKGR